MYVLELIAVLLIAGFLAAVLLGQIILAGSQERTSSDNESK